MRLKSVTPTTTKQPVKQQTTVVATTTARRTTTTVGIVAPTHAAVAKSKITTAAAFKAFQDHKADSVALE